VTTANAARSVSSATGTRPAPPPAARRRRRSWAPLWFLLPFGAVFTAFFVAPIGYAVYQSLLSTRRSGLGLGPTQTVFTGLSNYGAALHDAGFTGSLLRALLFMAVETPVMIVFAVLLALALDAASARFPAFFRTAFFAPYGVPGVVASLLWGFIYVPGISPITDVLGHIGVHADFLGPRTVLWSIANILTWEFAGYNMLVLTASLKAIPHEIYEAARIDGAGGLRIAWRIKIPLISGTLILVTVFTIIGTLQLFAEPLVLRGLTGNISDSYTPNLAAYTQAFTDNNYSMAAAESVILALAALVLSFAFLKIVQRRTGAPGVPAARRPKGAR
jgi:multiple sugar transport system permease protein